VQGSAVVFSPQKNEMILSTTVVCREIQAFPQSSSRLGSTAISFVPF